VQVSTAILCCGTPQELVSMAPSMRHVVERSWRIGDSPAGIGQGITLGFDPPGRSWVEPAASAEGIQVVALRHLSYQQPALIETGSGSLQTATRSFWWNSRFGSWMNLPADDHALIRHLVHQRGVVRQARHLSSTESSTATTAVNVPDVVGNDVVINS